MITENTQLIDAISVEKTLLVNCNLEDTTIHFPDYNRRLIYIYFWGNVNIQPLEMGLFMFFSYLASQDIF